MVDQIFPGLYRLEIPLPGNPLKSVNSYLIKGTDKNLLIDTGMNRPECKKAFNQIFQELNIDLHQTDILITHLHPDHAGLVPYLKSPHSRVYGSRADTEMLSNLSDSSGSSQYWSDLADFAVQNGFLEGNQAISTHPCFKFKPEHIEYDVIEDGTNIDINGISLKCILTPGHSRGHVCLYDEDKQILFSGGHILAEITPNIALFSNDYNPLHDYLQSLDKVFNLEVRMTLPSHRSIIFDHQERISELKKHHQLRCEDILKILEYGPANAYDIASRMTWDLKHYQWEEFPLPQKWLATGEVIAHLKYLCESGRVVEYDGEGVTLFSLPV